MNAYELSQELLGSNTSIAIAYLSTTFVTDDIKMLQEGREELTLEHIADVIDRLIFSRNVESYTSEYKKSDLQNALIKKLAKIQKYLIRKELGDYGSVFEYIESEAIETGSGINWTTVRGMTKEQADKLLRLSQVDVDEEGRIRVDIRETKDPNVFAGRVHNYRD